MKEADLRRILTTEERNVLVMVGRARGADELRLAARSLNMTDERVQQILTRAREKIERETRKGGRGMQTAVEEVRCLCGEKFTPRRKGELQCPACRELHGDGRSNGRSYHRENDHESAHNGGASGNGTGDHSEMARNPPPTRPFPSVAEVRARRDRIHAALVAAGGEAMASELKAATGIDGSTFGNDIQRLVADGRVRKVRIGPRRNVYRTPERDEQAGRDVPTAAESAREALIEEAVGATRESEVKSQEMLDGRDDAATPEEADFEWPEPPPGWRYADEPGEDGRRAIEKLEGDGSGSVDADGRLVVMVWGGDGDEGEDAPLFDRGDERSEEEVEAEEGPDVPQGDGWLHSDGEPDEEALHDERADDRPTVIEDDPVKVAQAHALLADIAASRAHAAELATRIYAEAEALAQMADAAVPETLLRARYIAALLHRIEEGDTSAELLDRFERLAFEAPS
jgi:hypothetical protein